MRCRSNCNERCTVFLYLYWFVFACTFLLYYYFKFYFLPIFLPFMANKLVHLKSQARKPIMTASETGDERKTSLVRRGASRGRRTGWKRRVTRRRCAYEAAKLMLNASTTTPMSSRRGFAPARARTYTKQHVKLIELRRCASRSWRHDDAALQNDRSVVRERVITTRLIAQTVSFDDI